MNYTGTMNSKHLFDDAKPGDLFKTRSGLTAIYVFHNDEGVVFHNLVLREPGTLRIQQIVVNPFGYCESENSPQEYDIIARKKKHISEAQLTKLAEAYESSLPDSYTWCEAADDAEGIRGVCSVCEIEKAYKAAFKEALNK